MNNPGNEIPDSETMLHVTIGALRKHDERLRREALQHAEAIAREFDHHAAEAIKAISALDHATTAALIAQRLADRLLGERHADHADATPIEGRQPPRQGANGSR